jgi:hypothetical protein
MSELLAYQRALTRVSLAREPSADDLALLGDPARFRMYRAMVRNRLEGMARVAFARTLEAVGEGAFTACFARYLEQVPPASPLIREVSAGFAEFALAEGTLFHGAASHALDMLRFEQAKWRVAYSDVPQPRVGEDGVRELDFERAPVLNPLLRCLRLSHRVHEPELRADLTLLFVYRPAGVDQVRWYTAEPWFFELVEACLARSVPLAEAVRTTCERCALTLDESFLERLSGAIAVALERGVLVGSR